MAERKVFNKYIPPDFDPKLVPKGERPAFNQIKVRSMLPMTICCTQCGEYMGRGTKFNARQEEAIGMEWMGLKRWRFYLKCSSCCQEMTFMTDPENDHYVTEHGCTRNFEPWRVKQEVNKILEGKKKEIESDSIKALENKSSIIKNQLDLMDTIADLQDINKKNAFMDHDKVINNINKKRKFNEMNEENKELEEFKKAKKQKLSTDKVLPFKDKNNGNTLNTFNFGVRNNNNMDIKDNDNDGHRIKKKLKKKKKTKDKKDEHKDKDKKKKKKKKKEPTQK